MMNNRLPSNNDASDSELDEFAKLLGADSADDLRRKLDNEK